MSELTLSSIPERVKRDLGHPTVAVYISDDTISDFIDDGIDLLSSNIFKKVQLAVPCKELQVLDKEEIMIVTDVQPYGQMDSRGFIYMRDDFTLTEAINFFNVNSTSLMVPLLASMNYNAMANIMGIKFDWHYDRHTGELYAENIPKNTTCLAVTAKVLFEKENLTKEHLTWLRKYVLAKVKITEGRIRSKYKEGSIGVTSDGDQLVSEGTAELTLIEEQLENFKSLDYGKRR